ncbi:MAG: LLM class flavin-dependent oxidoreductase, partial [Myxococcota bacterium]
MIERAAAARAAGLDSLFVGDHHATPAPYFQNVPMLGRLLAEWGDAPAGALFLLPLWDPVLLAEQIGTLASLTPGRFIAQCCVGADPAQFRAMGADPRKRGAEFERRFEVLQRLLAGEAVPRSPGEGPISIAPVPPEPVEYWIGAEAPVAIERAARLADAWLPGPNVPLSEAAAQLDDYLRQCERHGRTPRATPIRRNIHVAESAADLEERVRPALEGAGPGVDPGCVIVGTIDEDRKSVEIGRAH